MTTVVRILSKRNLFDIQLKKDEMSINKKVTKKYKLQENISNIQLRIIEDLEKLKYSNNIQYYTKTLFKKVCEWYQLSKTEKEYIIEAYLYIKFFGLNFNFKDEISEKEELEFYECKKIYYIDRLLKEELFYEQHFIMNIDFFGIIFDPIPVDFNNNHKDMLNILMRNLIHPILPFFELGQFCTSKNNYYIVKLMNLILETKHNILNEKEINEDIKKEFELLEVKYNLVFKMSKNALNYLVKKWASLLWNTNGNNPELLKPTEKFMYIPHIQKDVKWIKIEF